MDNYNTRDRERFRLRRTSVDAIAALGDRRQPLRQELEESILTQHRRLESWVEDLRTFFGADEADLVALAVECNPLEFVMWQRALAAMLPGWNVESECAYDGPAPALFRRAAIEVGPQEFAYSGDDGRQFWRGPSPTERFALDLYHESDRTEEYCSLRFTVPKHLHGWLLALLPKLREWSDANHFLRGRAFDATGAFLKLEDAPAWESVVLKPEVREELERQCIRLLAHRELYRANGVPLKRGIILHGPPGTGKTTIGKALAARCGVTFILATPGMLGRTVDVSRVFDWARRFAPTILFFEDFDMVAGNREEHGGSGILGEFLSCLDGVNSCNGVVTIATTNRLRSIEPALKDRPNRFDCLLEIGAPEADGRRTFIERTMEAHGGTVDIDRIVAATGGATGAQMQELCRAAVAEAVEAAIAAGAVAEPKRLALRDEDFTAALKRLRMKKSSTIGFHAPRD